MIKATLVIKEIVVRVKKVIGVTRETKVIGVRKGIVVHLTLHKILQVNSIPLKTQ